MEAQADEKIHLISPVPKLIFNHKQASKSAASLHMCKLAIELDAVNLIFSIREGAPNDILMNLEALAGR